MLPNEDRMKSEIFGTNSLVALLTESDYHDMDALKVSGIETIIEILCYFTYYIPAPT